MGTLNRVGLAMLLMFASGATGWWLHAPEHKLDGPKPPARVACSVIGQRIREEHLRGIIFGKVGAKAEVAVCTGVRLRFAFVGEAPEEYQELERLAEERSDVVGFNARGDGYIVTDDPGQYALLLTSLDRVREDPSVAKRVKAVTG